MDTIQASNLFGVDGLVAVITGGGTGIGLNMAQALEHNGAKKVYIVGRRKEALEEAAKTAKFGNIIPLVGDVTSQESLKEIAATVEKEVGYVNVLVANAGMPGPRLILPQNPTITDYQKALEVTPMSDFTEALNTNTTSVLYTAIAFLHLLDAANKQPDASKFGKAQVIATASTGAFNRNITSGYAYPTSKAAVVHMMKCLATNLAPFGIRFNSLCPGLFPSEMTAPLFAGKDITQEGSVPASMIPATRTGTVEDIAGSILYLASRAGAFNNGNCLLVDGGMISILPNSY